VEPRSPEPLRAAIGYSTTSFEDAIARASVHARDDLDLGSNKEMIVVELGFTTGPNPPFGEYSALAVQRPSPRG